MTRPVPMIEVLRGNFVESRHEGHAAITGADGGIVEAWGDPATVILPRSSAKMLQALPLLESGAGACLSTEQLALACASHSGERRHVSLVGQWLKDLGLDDGALLCGPQPSRDREHCLWMDRVGKEVTRAYNNCSGKHAGFITVARHLEAGLDYVDPHHPVQRAVRQAIEEICDEDSPGFGIDGCSAPNFAVSLAGLARAMARFASAGGSGGLRDVAMSKLVAAMIAHPDLVSGQGRACAALMELATEPLAVKTGAEGVYVAILPERKLGIALKIADGATRASEVAMAALLARLGAINENHPLLSRDIRNWDGLATGVVRPVADLVSPPRG
ncbi:MAG: asparaginase [Boseongicola sp. SB0677_bin_26]|nr:asparaginase [Boseongicola sp. SB0665_bin_10]MYG25111.1 asparaginase [Boseongicola sp. SB0677_bin_26]